MNATTGTGSALTLKEKGLRHLVQINLDQTLAFSIGPEGKGIETLVSWFYPFSVEFSIGPEGKGIETLQFSGDNRASRCSALALKEKGLRPAVSRLLRKRGRVQHWP